MRCGQAKTHRGMLTRAGGLVQSRAHKNGIGEDIEGRSVYGRNQNADEKPTARKISCAALSERP